MASINCTQEAMDTPTGRIAAIVGRPNVGKSALFNRLAGQRISIVHDQPGVTRDRLSAECHLGDAPFTVVDTGGIGSAVDASFTEQVRVEAEIAITTSSVILFVVDGQSGLTPLDRELASDLRRAQKPILLVVNKVDTEKHCDFESDFAALGFPEVISVSAEHGRGISGLVESVEAHLPEEIPKQTPDEAPVRICVIGRPNVGKSSLINAILQDRRTLVSSISGTTRDAVDVPYIRDGQHFLLIDTAGIRARGKQDNSVEVFSSMRSERSIRRADLCALVIDATMGVTSQDKKIGTLIQRARKPCIVAVNKCDLLGPIEKIRERVETFRQELFFLDYAPFVLISAKTGENVERLFKAIKQIRKESAHRIGTGPLNRLLQAAIDANPPPLRANKRFKILYATHAPPHARTGPIAAPVFVVFVNSEDILPDSYRKHLEACLREESRFMGLPIIFEFRGRESKKEHRETLSRGKREEKNQPPQRSRKKQ